METLKINKKLIISCILVFILAFVTRLHFINLKQGFHCDEAFSMTISNVSEYGWTQDFPKNRVFTGKELKQLSLFNDSSLKDTINDIKTLYIYNNDSPHTNLYYTALRVWFTGFDDTNYKQMIYRGCSLNLLFFSLSFILMFKILRKLFKDNALIPFGLFAAFMNTGSISNTLFMRPYQLQETIFLLLVYNCIHFFYDIKENKFLTKKNFVIMSFLLALTLLSGYFSIPFIAIIGTALIIVSIKEKQFKNIAFLSGGFLLSVGLAYLFYHGYFYGFSSHRAEGVLAVLTFTTIKTHIKQIASSFYMDLTQFLYYIPCVILLVIAGIHKAISKNIDTEKQNITLTIILLSLGWSTLIYLVAPYLTIRYIYPALPILALLYPYVICNFRQKTKYTYMTLISLIMLLLAYLPTPSESTYPKPPLKVFGSSIENLFVIERQAYPFIMHPKIPVIIANTDGKRFYVTELVPLFNDEQLFITTDIPPTVKTTLKEYYLLTDRDATVQETNSYKIAEEISLAHRDLKVLKIERK